MNRHVPLSGQPNFRDLGGYAASDGRTVKWGQVFRSGELSQLSTDDVRKLGALGIRAVVDLRSPEEVSARGAGRLPSEAKSHPVPIASRSKQHYTVRSTIKNCSSSTSLKSTSRPASTWQR